MTKLYYFVEYLIERRTVSFNNLNDGIISEMKHPLSSKLMRPVKIFNSPYMISLSDILLYFVKQKLITQTDYEFKSQVTIQQTYYLTILLVQMLHLQGLEP